MEINENDIDWSRDHIVGAALMLGNLEEDSYRNPLNPDLYYKVGKHIDGHIVVIPTGINAMDYLFNQQLRLQNRLN